MTHLNESHEPEDEYRELVAILQQLKPAHNTLSAEDTFYRAGWQAATHSTSKTVKASHGRHSASWRFTTGLVCGLLISVAGFLRPEHENKSQLAADSASTHENTSHELNPATPDVLRSETATTSASSKDVLAQTLALLPFGNRIHPNIRSSTLLRTELQRPEFDALNGPHVGMGSLAQLVPRTSPDPSVESPAVHSTRPLSALPLSAEIIDELL